MPAWRFCCTCFFVLLLSACAGTAPANEGRLAGGAFTQVESARIRHAKSSTDRVIQDEKGTVVVQMVPYRTGVSSATVEQMSRKFGCAPSGGAGLLTEDGPIEVYRVQCEDGRYFMAQCELRQCRPVRQ